MENIIENTVKNEVDINIDNTRVRFHNNKPYMAKKIILTTVVTLLLFYFYISLPLVAAIAITIFSLIWMLVKINKTPADGGKFSDKVKYFIKNNNQGYLIDTLPVKIKIKEDRLLVRVVRAERFTFDTVDECFSIKKDKIAGILYDDIDEELLIVFQDATITARTSDGNKVKRTATQSNGSLCFGIKNSLEILDNLYGFNYPVEILSEISDEDEETEDPELVNKDKETITENGEEPTVPADIENTNQDVETVVAADAEVDDKENDID